MIVILAGAPGAGKGTQADLLAEREGFKKVSTGDALRSQIKQDTEVGKLAKGFMDEGKLVPDDVLLRILEAELDANSGSRILLDGYPRNIAQAKTLEGLKRSYPVKAVIHLEVGKEKLIERICGRRTCSQSPMTFGKTHVLNYLFLRKAQRDISNGISLSTVTGLNTRSASTALPSRYHQLLLESTATTAKIKLRLSQR